MIFYEISMSRIGVHTFLARVVQMRHKLDIPGNLRLTGKYLTVPINRYTTYTIIPHPNPRMITHLVCQFWGHKLHGYSVEWSNSNSLLIKWEYMLFNRQWRIVIDPRGSIFDCRTHDYTLKTLLNNSMVSMRYEQSSVIIKVEINRHGAYINVQDKSSSSSHRYELNLHLSTGNVLVKTLDTLKRLNYLNDYLPSWADRMI